MSGAQAERCRIVVTRLLPHKLMRLLQSSFHAWTNPDDRTLEPGEIAREAAAIRADALLVMAMDRIDAWLIHALPDCVRVIATFSVGHDHIDLDAARARGIAVLSTPDVLSDAVADMGMLLLLGAARRAHEASLLLYSGAWRGWSPTQLLGCDVTTGWRGILAAAGGAGAALFMPHVARGQAALRREQVAVAAGLDLTGSNPSPTNIASGLSSIEEKSLGSIAKSGQRAIEGLIDYGERPPGPGLWTMDASAYAPKSLTGFVAAGTQIVLFTTGVGNSYVSALSPTIKLSANPATCASVHQQLDFDASAAFLGRESLEPTGEALRRRVLAIASGEMTWGEILEEGDEVLSRFGPAL